MARITGFVIVVVMICFVASIKYHHAEHKRGFLSKIKKKLEKGISNPKEIQNEMKKKLEQEAAKNKKKVEDDALKALAAENKLIGTGGIASKIKIYGAENTKSLPTFILSVLKASKHELEAQNKDSENIVEGDVKLAGGMIAALQGNLAGVAKNLKWPSSTIPYTFDPSMTSHKKAAVQAAFEDFEKYTCLRFVARTTEPDYITFKKDRDMCYSNVGRIGGEQIVSIGSECGYKGIALHEIMHALGFFHEHTRDDRDKYIKIKWNNIENGKDKNFRIHDSNIFQHQSPYDMSSIMHWSRRAFGKLGGLRDTIKSMDKKLFNSNDLGQRKGFSEADLQALRKNYCDDVVSPTTLAPLTTTTTTREVTLAPPTTTTTTREVTLAPPTTTTREITLAPSTTTTTTREITLAPPTTTTTTREVTLAPPTTTTTTREITLAPSTTTTREITLAPSTTTTTTREITLAPPTTTTTTREVTLAPSTTTTTTREITLAPPTTTTTTREVTLAPSTTTTTTREITLAPSTTTTTTREITLAPSTTTTTTREITIAPPTTTTTTREITLAPPTTTTTTREVTLAPSTTTTTTPEITLAPSKTATTTLPPTKKHATTRKPTSTKATTTTVKSAPTTKTSVKTKITTKIPTVVTFPPSTSKSNNEPNTESANSPSNNVMSGDPVDEKDEESAPSPIMTTNIPILNPKTKDPTHVANNPATSPSTTGVTTTSRPTVVGSIAAATKAITLIPGLKKTTKSKLKRKSTTTTAAPSNCCGCTGAQPPVYPCWPSDFVWSAAGIPKDCNCSPGETMETCKCNCVNVNTKSSTAWENNYLCYKSRIKNPKFKWKVPRSESGNCTPFTKKNANNDWQTFYLCTKRNTPYKFAWSTQPDISNKCLKIDEPEDSNWKTKYLCA